MDNNNWNKNKVDNEDVVEENELLHEHEDGVVHSHEGGDVEHSHEEVVEEVVEEVIEEVVKESYDIAVFGSDSSLVSSVEDHLLGLGASFKVLSSIDEFVAGPWFVLCDPDWDAFVLASQLNEVTPSGIGRSTLLFTTKSFTSSNVPYATGRIVVPYDSDDEDLDRDALAKDNVDYLLDPLTDPK